ncbi:MAG: cupin domain-containing protein [Clostridia bacterium]
MMIDFEKIDNQIIPNFRGGSKEVSARMFVDSLNKIMFGELKPGASIGMHTHETSSEIIYFVQGTGKMLYDGVSEKIHSGLCHYCPKGHAHSMINDGDENLVFFAVVPEQ